MKAPRPGRDSAAMMRASIGVQPFIDTIRNIRAVGVCVRVAKGRQRVTATDDFAQWPIVCLCAAVRVRGVIVRTALGPAAQERYTLVIGDGMVTAKIQDEKRRRSFRGFRDDEHE